MLRIHYYSVCCALQKVQIIVYALTLPTGDSNQDMGITAVLCTLMCIVDN